MRRGAAAAAATFLGAALLPLLAGCGGTGQISVTLNAGGGAGTVSYKPGQSATFTAIVLNNGPGDAPGVAVTVALPPSFRYEATDVIDDSGSARTQPLDARVGSPDPQWGFWDIAAPGSGGNVVKIVFSVDVEGSPDAYDVSARAQGDNTSGIVVSKSLVVEVTPAPVLGLQARVDEQTLHAGSTATYRVTITNTGSANADGVSLLVTLPPVMQFDSSVTPFAGNASRSSPINPVRGSVEVFYGGFTLPAESTAGPGYVVVAFQTVVVPAPEGGTFAISAEATDSDGDIVNLNKVATVTVQPGGGTGGGLSSLLPSPTAQPAPSPTPSSQQ